MLGAIYGDVVGSRFEVFNAKSKNVKLFDGNCEFTDDTVLTVATAAALLEYHNFYNAFPLETLLTENYRRFIEKYMKTVAFGKSTLAWYKDAKSTPLNSSGNGAAMRVSPVGWCGNTEEEVRELAEISTRVTYDNDDAVKGAEAVALCIFFARKGKTKEFIKEYIEKNYFSLKFDYNDLVKNYEFSADTMKSVPQAIFCFIIGTDFEDTIRNGLGIGGDTDTICSIAGAIAEAFYKMTWKQCVEPMEYLDGFNQLNNIISRWLQYVTKERDYGVAK